jgi:DNA-binding MarR family transcriptional regulator
MVEQSAGGVPGSASEPSSELADLRRLVAAYVAAGADESVQRVITAVHRVSRRLNQWYDQQLADIDLSGGEWTVLSEIARADGNRLTPTQLASAAHVAPSSMTHRLDRMILVGLTGHGCELYAATIRESNLVESDLMRGLTARQVDDLAHLLEKLLAGLDASSLRSARPESAPPESARPDGAGDAG